MRGNGLKATDEHRIQAEISHRIAELNKLEDSL
jgi:hypothetical protein